MKNPLPPRFDRSWWLRDALAADPGEPCPPLARELAADVLIVGGGYTGMWTAYFLKERDPGIDVVLLEQDICGGGPSGRNGGFVNGLWDELGVLVERHGGTGALETCRTAARSVHDIAVWCERHGVDAWYRKGGDLGVATSMAQDGAWAEDVEAARSLGEGDVHVELSPLDVRERCRSPLFRAGVFRPEAATVQPARLARGIRRVLLERGVRIFEGAPVRRFRPGPPAEAETPGGTVRAGRAIIAAGAWSSRWRQFRRSLIVRGSYIVLTARAPERLAEIGWTGGEGIYDYRTALHYLRTTPDGRIAFGGAGVQPGFRHDIGPRFDHHEGSTRRVAEDLWRMFPSFREVPLEAAWGGPIDVSGAHLPFFGSLPSGNVHYGIGYTGNGVGPCHLGGRILSGLALGVEDEFTALPIVGAGPVRFPPEPLRTPGALVVTRAILRKDRAEDEDRRPGRLVDALARLPRRLGYNLGP
ncbi:MAG: NAD(P)/FAD-dependent oxidoreductase [Actinomycetota bacterium]